MIGKGLHPAAKSLVACPAFRMLQLLQLISSKPGIGQLLHTGQLRQQCTEGIAITVHCSATSFASIGWRTGPCTVMLPVV
jgi:hypothetical protein